LPDRYALFTIPEQDEHVKIIVVGAGIIGMTHARTALMAGHEVVHLERDPAPQSASVRNFGLIWVSGRKSGEELDVAIRAREIWEEIHHENPELIFRGNGSLTLAQNEAELRVMEECLEKSDSQLRKWEILGKKETQKVNPALRGNFLASLWCPLDGAVEPDSVLTSLRDGLTKSSKYIWRSSVDIIDIKSSGDRVTAVAKSGEIFEGDFLIHCPGADHSSIFKEQFDSAPIRKVYLQMMSTEPFTETITTSIADGDSMRYYPGYDVPSVSKLPPQHPVAKANHMQLLLVQRADGTITMGDTHAYDEPFPFKLEEEPYEYLHDVASDLFGTKLPPIRHRWSGVYSQQTEGAVCDRRRIATNIISVTGPGGRGNSLAPAIAETTLKEIK
jgi:FAD dependent oxidoreductase TIGR03364